MIKKIVWNWERLDDNTHRARVIGGWLVKHVENKNHSTLFIADRDHEWQVIPPYTETAPSKPKVIAADFSPK